MRHHSFRKKLLYLALLGVSTGASAFADINTCKLRGDCPPKDAAVANLNTCKLRGDCPPKDAAVVTASLGNFSQLRGDKPGSGIQGEGTPGVSSQAVKTGSPSQGESELNVCGLRRDCPGSQAEGSGQRAE